MESREGKRNKEREESGEGKGNDRSLEHKGSVFHFTALGF
jgi:hypothetical protein